MVGMREWSDTDVSGARRPRRGVAAIGGLLVLLLASAAAWYLFSPSWALAGVRDAALDRDTEELGERIDFPAVRESLKAQLAARLTAEMQKEAENNPFAGLGGALAMGFIGPMIDAMITPDGMITMMQQGQFKKPGTSGPTANEKPVEWTIERNGFDRFKARNPKADPDKQIALNFRRDGLGWKLIGMEIPRGADLGK